MSKIYTIKSKTNKAYLHKNNYWTNFYHAQFYIKLNYAERALNKYIKTFSSSAPSDPYIVEYVLGQEYILGMSPEETKETKDPRNMNQEELEESIKKLSNKLDILKSETKSTFWDYWTQKLMLEDYKNNAINNNK